MYFPPPKPGDAYSKQLQKTRICGVCEGEFLPGYRPQRGNINDRFCPECRKLPMLYLYHPSYKEYRYRKIPLSEEAKKRRSEASKRYWKRLSPEKKKEIYKKIHQKRKKFFEQFPEEYEKFKAYGKAYYYKKKEEKKDLKILNRLRRSEGLKPLEKLPSIP